MTYQAHRPLQQALDLHAGARCGIEKGRRPKPTPIHKRSFVTKVGKILACYCRDFFGKTEREKIRRGGMNRDVFGGLHAG